MRRYEFIGRVQHQAGLSSMAEADRVTSATLQALRQQVPARLANSIAAQLPPEIGGHLRRTASDTGAGARQEGRSDLVARVAARAGVSEEEAAPVVRAVIDVLYAATEGGMMAEVSENLPPDLREYAGPGHYHG